METQVSVSQSLFQVYYLGSTEVDRRCSAAVLPWMIEEMKLKLDTAQDMKLVWITLGPVNIAYVADSGKELQRHSYDDILRCTTGLDNVSFAYITHDSKDNKTSCHVFQSLDLDESAVIIEQFKEHNVSMDNKNEPILFSGEKLTALTRQSKMQKLKSKSRVNRQSTIDPNADTYFPVTYCGSLPVSYNRVTASIVDTFVGCLSIKSRPTSAVKYKKWRKKRRSVPLTSPQSNTMFQLLSSGSDDIDLPGNLEEEEDEEKENDGSPTTQSLSDFDLNSQNIDSFLILENPDTRPRARTISGTTYHPPSYRSVDDQCLPDIHITHESTHRKHTYSEPGLKKRKWGFGILRRDRSSSSAEKIDSDSSLKGGDSPSSLMNTDSLSSLQQKDSEGSLRENDSEGESPLTKKTVPNRASTAPTPAIPVTESLESSGNDENDGDGQNDSKEELESLDSFDMLPELEQLSQDPSFAFMGPEEIVLKIRSHVSSLVPSTLIISGEKMTISTLQKTKGSEEQNEDEVYTRNSNGNGYKTVLLVDTPIQKILCCSQGKTSAEYVAFVTKERGTKAFILHLLRSVGGKGAVAIIKAFKAAVEYRIVASLPNMLCDSCPINHLNTLCKKLNDMPQYDAISQLHDMLLVQITESDYSTMVKEFVKRPFENEHSQLVRWVSLLRKFFHSRQTSHNHGVKQEKEKGLFYSHSFGNKKGRKLLASAKLSESYDNLNSNKKDRRSELKIDNIGLQSHSSTDIGGGCNGSTSPMGPSPTERSLSALSSSFVAFNGRFDDVHITPSESREGSNATTPDIPRHKYTLPTSISFPPTDHSSFLKLNHMEKSRPRTDSGSPNPINEDTVSVDRSPFQKGHKRSMSWRQQIFESVTPSKTEELMKRRASIKQIVMEIPSSLKQQLSFSEISEDESPSSRAKRRWKWAIEQEVLLVKLEKENQSVIRETLRRKKLNYEDPTVDSVVIGRVWIELMDQQETSTEDLLAAVKMGIPPKMRERAWRLLVAHYQSLHPGEVPTGNYPSSVDQLEFQQLCDEETEDEPVIVADLDRTFPSHPYFTHQHGQKTLHNVLHAYAVSDKEVGYCQGLSFVAGIILMHSPDQLEAFVLLNHLMYMYGFRDIYSQDMYVLQTKLYQFSRLLHDHLPNLYAHLEGNDVTSFLYAAPWFLTIFSSQFPIPFVARVFDLVLFEGVEAIFKVCLSLLIHYQFEILQCDHMETITDYIKIHIPLHVMESCAEILHTATQLGELSTRLQTFETEYHVMHELMATFHKEKRSGFIDVESENELLRKQNKELIEQVVVCRGAILRLEKAVQVLGENFSKQQKRMDRFEKEMNSKQYTHQSTQTLPITPEAHSPIRPCDFLSSQSNSPMSLYDHYERSLQDQLLSPISSDKPENTVPYDDESLSVEQLDEASSLNKTLVPDQISPQNDDNLEQLINQTVFLSNGSNDVNDQYSNKQELTNIGIPIITLQSSPEERVE